MYEIPKSIMKRVGEVKTVAPGEIGSYQEPTQQELLEQFCSSGWEVRVMDEDHF